MAAIRFGLRPTVGSVTQTILAFSPILAVLIYFLYLAHDRPSQPCYTEDLSDEEIEIACKLIPLENMVFVYLLVGCVWACLGVYLASFVPRCEKLIQQYLDEGVAILGNIHYEPGQKSWTCSQDRYGYALYLHPNYNNLPVFIRRQVRVSERYTREREQLLLLDGMPFSAQPRHELEIDREIFRHNDISMKIITVFVWLLVIFCYAAPVYIVKVIYDMYQAGFAEYHPNYDGMDAVYVYALIGGIFTPSVAFIVNLVTWSHYE